MEDMIHDMVAPYDFPVAFDFPVGHVDRNLPLVLSMPAAFEVDVDKVSLCY